MAEDKVKLQIVLEARTKEIEKIVKAFQEISQKGKTTEKRLQAVKKANDDLTISFKRLFQIVILYVGAFETLHKVLNITGDSIATMVNYNRQLENMMYGLATTLTMISDVKIGDRVLRGFEEFNFQLKIANDLLEKMREKSMQAFVPLESTFETFRAIAGFVLQQKGTLEDAIDLAIKGSQAIQALALPMNQVVQEMRDLLQGGIQPASSTLAMILGINDTLINQWKEQGILLDMLKEKFKDLEYTMSEKFKTLEGKIFVITEFFKRALGEGGKPLYEGFKTVLDDLINSLFEVERKTVKVRDSIREVFKITPKTEFLNAVRSIAEGLKKILYITYAFGKALTEFIIKHQETFKTLVKIIGIFITYKVLLTSVKVIYHSFTSIVSSSINVFIRFYEVFTKIIVGFKSLSGILKITAVKWIAIITVISMFIGLIVKFGNVVEYLEDIITGKKSFEDIKSDIVNFGKNIINEIKKPIDYIYNEIFGKYEENLKKLQENQLKSLRDTIGKYKGEYELIYTGEKTNQALQEQLTLMEKITLEYEYRRNLIELNKENEEKYLALLKLIDETIVKLKQNEDKLTKTIKEKVEYTNFLIRLEKERKNILEELKKKELDIWKEYRLKVKVFRKEIKNLENDIKRYRTTEYEGIKKIVEKYREQEKELERIRELFIKIYGNEAPELIQRVITELEKLREEKEKYEKILMEYEKSFKDKFVEGIRRGINQAKNEYSKFIDITREAFINIVQSIESAFQQLFLSIIKGFKNLGDVLNNFKNTLLNIATNYLAKMTMRTIINPQSSSNMGFLGKILPYFGQTGIGLTVASLINRGKYGGYGALAGSIIGSVLNATAWGTAFSTAIGSWVMQTVGGALGTALGSAIGNFILPVGGAIIGSIIGSAIGKMLGGENRGKIRSARAEFIDRFIEEWLRNSPIPVTQEDMDNLLNQFTLEFRNQLQQYKKELDIPDIFTEQDLTEIAKRTYEGILKGLSPEEIKNEIIKWIETEGRGWGIPETEKLINRILDNYKLFEEKIRNELIKIYENSENIIYSLKEKLLIATYGEESFKVFEYRLSQIIEKIETLSSELENISHDNYYSLYKAYNLLTSIYDLSIQRYEMEINYISSIINQLDSFISYSDNILYSIYSQLGKTIDYRSKILELYNEYLNLENTPDRWEKIQQITKEAYTYITRLIEQQKRAYQEHLRRQQESLNRLKQSIKEQYEEQIKQLRELAKIFKEIYDYAWKKLYQIQYERKIELLAPVEQLTNVKNMINQFLPLALSGNQDAFNRLKYLIDTYQKLIERYYYVGTQGWIEEYEWLEGILNQLEQAGLQYKNYEEQIIELEKEMNEKLNQINASISNISNITSTYIPPATRYLEELAKILEMEKQRAEQQREELKNKLEETKDEYVRELQNIKNSIVQLIELIKQSVEAENKTAINIDELVDILRQYNLINNSYYP